MLLHNDTYQQQSNFASYCRTGIYTPIKGVRKERLAHYPQLVYNVIDDTLRSAYPLTVDLLTEEEWDTTVRSFFATHKCSTYSVWKMPYEFYQFVLTLDNSLTEKYPFLEELLLFEWTEIEIHMMEDEVYPEVESKGEMVMDTLGLNPEYTILQLHYPVHLKNPNEITAADKSEYFVLLFREQESGNVQFLDLSFYFVWLIRKIEQEQKSLLDLTEEASELFGVNQNVLVENSLPFLTELQNKKFIIGYKK